MTYTSTAVRLQNLLAIEGDTDGDGDTDTVDLTTAIINFTSARNAAAAVPEPSGLLLLVLAVGCLAATRRRSCRS